MHVNLKKMAQFFQFSVRPCPSQPSVATGRDRKQFQCLNIVLHNKTGLLGIAPLTLFVANFSRKKTRLLTKSSFLDRFSTSQQPAQQTFFFFRVFAGERRQALVSEKRQTRATGKQKKQRPVHIPLFCCIPPQTYPLMALLTRFALAFAPASGLIAFARLKNARLLCRLASQLDMVMA